VLKLGSSFFVTLACLTRPTAIDAAVRLASPRCGGPYLEAAWCSSHDVDFPFTNARGPARACMSALNPVSAQTLHCTVILFLHAKLGARYFPQLDFPQRTREKPPSSFVLSPLGMSWPRCFPEPGTCRETESYTSCSAYSEKCFLASAAIRGQARISIFGVP